MIRVLLLCCISITLVAQKPIPVLKQLRPDGTLPAPERANAFFQDSLGYVWIGTDLRLERYDGARYKSPVRWQFPDRAVRYMFSGPEGQPAYLSENGNVYFIEADTIRPYAHNGVLSKNMRPNQIQSLAFDGNGKLHIGHQSLGYLTLDTSGKADTLNSNTHSNRGITVTRVSNRPFIFSRNNFGNGESVITFLSSDGLLRKQIPRRSNRFLSRPSAVESHNGNLFLLDGDHHLIIVKQNSIEEINLPFHPTELFIDSRNTLWIGTDGHGIHFYPKCEITPQNKRIVLQGRTAAVSLEDHAGGLWIKTDNECYHIQLPYFDYYPVGTEELPEPFGVAICNDQQNVYVSYGSVGLKKLEKGRFISINTPLFHKEKGKTVSSLMYDDKERKLWAGGVGQWAVRNHEGVWSLGELPDSLKNERVYTIRKLSTGQVVLTTFFRLVIIGPKGIDFVSDELPSRLFNVCEGDSSNLYLATGAGIFDFANESISFLGDRHPFLTSAATDVIFRKGRLIIACQEAAVTFASSDSIWEIIEPDGIYARVLNMEPFNDSEILALGGRGITFINDSGKSITTSHHPLEEGASFSHLRPISILGDSVYICAGEGLYVLAKKDIKKPHNFPRVLVEDISIAGNDTTVHDRYVLPHDQNSFRLTYTGIFFGSLDKRPGFIYKLSNVDKGWQPYTNEFKLRYTSLDPGEYELLIKARVGYEMWGEPAKVHFTILPPFWQTWWFRFLVGLVFVGLVTALFFWRTKQIIRHEKQKSRVALEMARLEVRAIKAQLNPHFIFNAISSVKYYLANNCPEDAESYLMRFAQLIRSVLNNLEKTTIPLSEEIQLMKTYIALESERFNGSEIQFINQFDQIDPDKICVPPLLFQPYIENAIWHGLQQKEGIRKILIFVTVDQDSLNVSIEDNGIGRKEANKYRVQSQKERSFGMMIASRRIEALHPKGDVVIEDLYSEFGNAQGTRVSFTVPLVIRPGAFLTKVS